MIHHVDSPFAASRGRRRALLLCVTLLAAGAFGSTTAHAGTFTRGFVDDVWFDGSADGVTPQGWFRRTVATGAKLVQIEVDWTSVEPHAPKPGASHTSPAAPQFNFAYVDQRVEEVTRAGLQPVLLVTDAPRWAQGKGGTRTEYAEGGYKPNAKAFGQLAHALAKRYSGSYAKPLARGKKLPRVRYMQAWGEANTSFHLAPQWTRVNGRAVNTGAIIYRQLLNAFYAGVKAGDPRATVIFSGLEGYGDAPFTGLNRTHPVTFTENVLCLGATLKRVRCAGSTAHFDVFAADPYDSFAPTTHAVSKFDASAPDLGRLTKLVKAGLRAHTVLPHKPKPLWVTEFGYDSKPPNRQAVSTATQAKWLEEGFYTFWREGASAAMWYLVRDQPPPYTINYASGVYFRNGKRKPSFTAYRFPFVVMSTSKTSTQVWGIAPAGGTVRVQFQSHGSWRTLRAFHRGAGAIFDFSSSNLSPGRYRATESGRSSLVWTH
jgi:hypothetical protein